MKRKHRSQRGIAQVPLILGLLLIGLALPAAMRLVRERQETRRSAAIDEPCKICVGNYCREVASPPHCSHSKNECSSNINCKSTPTSTPRPTARPTVRPTSAPECSGTSCECRRDQVYCCSSGRYIYKETCSYTCRGGSCISVPTSAPTPRPTTPAGTQCIRLYDSCQSSYDCYRLGTSRGQMDCPSGQVCCEFRTSTPTPRPTTRPTSTPYNACRWSTAVTACVGNCSVGTCKAIGMYRCGCVAAPTPTPKPTSVTGCANPSGALYSFSCGSWWGNNTARFQCKSDGKWDWVGNCSSQNKVCKNGSCVAAPTPTPTTKPGCLSNNTVCEFSDTTAMANCSDCCNGYYRVGTTGRCGPAPTPTAGPGAGACGSRPNGDKWCSRDRACSCNNGSITCGGTCTYGCDSATATCKLRPGASPTPTTRPGASPTPTQSYTCPIWRANCFLTSNGCAFYGRSSLSGKTCPSGRTCCGPMLTPPPAGQKCCCERRCVFGDPCSLMSECRGGTIECSDVYCSGVNPTPTVPGGVRPTATPGQVWPTVTPQPGQVCGSDADCGSATKPGCAVQCVTAYCPGNSGCGKREGSAGALNCQLYPPSGTHWTDGYSACVSDSQPTQPPSGPTATTAPGQPTATSVPTGPEGCKLCPDGRRIEASPDYNCDGVIGIEDFAGWYDDFILESDNLYADFSCDGTVGLEDFGFWYDEWIGS